MHVRNITIALACLFCLAATTAPAALAASCWRLLRSVNNTTMGCRHIAALVLVCFALVGCTEGQLYALKVSMHAQADMVPFRACQTQLEADPQFIRVYQKIAVSTAADPFREPTPAQLSDNEIISDTDKLLFLAWFAKLQVCSTPMMEDMGRLAPELEAYFADAQADQADLLNEFLVNRHTFGEANAAISAFKARIKVLARETGTNLQKRYDAWDQEERQQTAENVAFLVGYVAVIVATRGRASVQHLADRQSALAGAEASYMRMHPSEALLHRVRVVQCDGIGRTLRCVLR
jgi:hypothetical protein